MASCFIWFGTGCSTEHTENQNENFIIYQSFITDGGGYKRTDLLVIINKKDCDETELFEEIKEAHSRMNGKSDKLTITLYRSNEELLTGNQMAERVFFPE